MNISQLVELAEVAVSQKRGLALNHLQKVILQECCQHETKTYEQIASDHSYSPSYLKKKAIPLLWKTLSDTFEEKVTKANCRSVLEKNVTDLDNFSAPEVALERPDGPVPLGSPFYIPRVRWERLGCEELLEPGGLLCLQGASKVGKTSLLVRLLDRLETHGYRTVRLSLNRASTTVLSSVETFARWLCANITQQVDAEFRLQKFWHEEVGDLTNCSLYLQQYLLDRSPIPIVLAIDEFDRLFDRPTIADDFICLLRSWYEEAKDCRAWQKLRIVLVYSTESHLLLKTGKSPVNIGLTLDVPPLDTAQVRALAARHRFYLSASDVDRLQSLLEVVRAMPGGERVHAFPLSDPPADLPERGVLINATSLGLQAEDPAPFDVNRLPVSWGVYDMIYNPDATRLLKEARARGLAAANGLSMLVHQGARSLEIWSHDDVDAHVMMRAACHALDLPPRYA